MSQKAPLSRQNGAFTELFAGSMRQIGALSELFGALMEQFAALTEQKAAMTEQKAAMARRGAWPILLRGMIYEE